MLQSCCDLVFNVSPFVLGMIKYIYLFYLLNVSGSMRFNSCLDESGAPVDWFVLYKIPKLKGHSNPLIHSGLGYAYITSAHVGGWTLSEKSINDSASIPGLTLSSLFTASQEVEDVLYILYNDQPPIGNVVMTGGHTKGVVVARSEGGFWLVHSVPHYPPAPTAASYAYPRTGLKNGQSFLCISLNANQLEPVGTQLMYNDPHVFAHMTPAALSAQFPTLAQAALGVQVHSPPWFHANQLVSAAGVTFQTFAKSPKFNKELYSDWVVTSLKVNMLAETWPNGRGRLNSSCHNPFRVENVDGVKVGVVGDCFSSHKDHSKWAVSEEEARPWVCIGDINRATTQAHRGGGTVCLQDAALWKAYYDSVSSIESCRRPRSWQWSDLTTLPKSSWAVPIIIFIYLCSIVLHYFNS